MSFLGDLEPDTPAACRDASVLRTTIPYLLWNEFCERMAFYGLSTNLILYMTEVVGQSPGSAAVSINLFEGTCYLTPLLGAWLADAVWGRFKTILVFSWIYVVGMFLLVASAASPLKSMVAFYVALYTVALGTGGIKANNSTFGADQFDDDNPRDRLEKRSFFNWFYFSINVGSLIASTIVVYIQENISWTLGFAIPAAAMLLAIIIFMAGQARYKHVRPSHSPLERIVNVTKAAWKQRRKSFGGDRDSGDCCRLGRVRTRRQTDPEAEHRSVEAAESEPLVLSARELSPENTELSSISRHEQRHWLDFALDRYPAEQVNDVKLVYALLPVFFATILYWTVYMQMGSFFVVQGSMMDRRVGPGSFEIPAASLAVIDTVAIVGLIPIYDMLFEPMLRRIGHPMTTLKRIGWGLVICSWSMIAAAVVEHKRLEAVHKGDSPLSIWYQIPQYVLVGASEIFTSIGTMEFFYEKAPETMRSCSSALQLLSVCIGSYLSSFLVVAVQWLSTLGGGQGFLPPDLDQGRLDAFFMLLAFCMCLNAFVFAVWVCRRFYSTDK